MSENELLPYLKTIIENQTRYHQQVEYLIKENNFSE